MYTTKPHYTKKSASIAERTLSYLPDVQASGGSRFTQDHSGSRLVPFDFTSGINTKACSLAKVVACTCSILSMFNHVIVSGRASFPCDKNAKLNNTFKWDEYENDGN